MLLQSHNLYDFEYQSIHIQAISSSFGGTIQQELLQIDPFLTIRLPNFNQMDASLKNNYIHGDGESW